MNDDRSMPASSLLQVKPRLELQLNDALADHSRLNEMKRALHEPSPLVPNSGLFSMMLVPAVPRNPPATVWHHMIRRRLVQLDGRMAGYSRSLLRHPSRRHLAWALRDHDLRGAMDEVGCEPYTSSGGGKCHREQRARKWAKAG